MYNVRNVSGKDLAIMLEKGGVILRPNKCVDLDLYCSRRWILSNFDLRKLVTKGFLQLTHDSRAVLPKAPVKPIHRMPVVGITSKKVVSNKPVEVVDLVSFPDVEIDDRGQVNIQKDAVAVEAPVEVTAKVVEPAKVEPPVEETLVAAPVAAANAAEEPAVVQEVQCEKAEAEAEAEVEIVNEVEKAPEEQVEQEETEEKQEEKTEEEVVFGGFEFSKSKKKKHLKTRR